METKNSTVTADMFVSDYSLLYNYITTVGSFMTALAISNSHAIHKKSPGRVTRFSADSGALNHLNDFNCPAGGAASSCSALRTIPSIMF